MKQRASYFSDCREAEHHYYYAAIHVYIREWEADGKGHPSNPRTIFSKYSETRTAAERCRSFALPLMSFACADDLTQRVVDPLLEDIKSFSGKAK